jgi:2-haloacid dehalogenase
MTKFQGIESRDIKAFVFDAYGTLFDIHSPTDHIASQLGDKADGISELWRAKQLQYSWLRSLMRDHTDFWKVTGDALDYTLEVFDVKDEGIREELMNLYLSLDPYPDSAPILQKLAENNRRCAILSNGAPHMLSAIVDNSGFADLLEFVISVEDAGIYKPDPSIYQLAVDSLNVAKENICYVSANAWDCAGSSHFGFQVAHVNRFGQPLEHLPAKPKAEITDLSQLAGLLE